MKTISKEVKSKAVSMDLIDRYDEARMQLDAFLDGIYNTAQATDASETITVFCSMAQGKVKEMDKVFKEITKGNGGNA